MEWSQARQIAANYQSPGSTGIGFAQFASTGTVTPELWENIRYCEAHSDEDYAEGRAGDMVMLRALLKDEGITERSVREERAKTRALAALQAYHNLTFPSGELGEPGDSTVFSEAVVDLLTDLRFLVWGNGMDFEALNDQASETYCEEVESEGN